MLDWSSVFYSFGIHTALVIVLAWSSGFGVKPAPVKREVMRASVVLPPVSAAKPVVEKSPEKKKPPVAPPVIKPKPKPKPQPKPESVQPPKTTASVSKHSKPPEPVEELAKKVEPDVPEIDLPLIPEWTAVLTEEQEALDQWSEALEKDVAQRERGLEVRAHYVELIRNRVARFWVRPLSARNGMEVELSLRLLPDGTVHRVEVSKSSGDGLFDRACLQAVQRAGTLPVPEDSAIFNQSFKRFRIKFRPEDLQR